MDDFKKELEQKILDLQGVKMLIESGFSFSLIGGAIISAMDGTVPKDYDLLWSKTTNSHDFVYMSSKGFNLICETSNAYTYEKNGLIFQFIKSNVNTFDYSISQITFNKGNTHSLSGDLYNLKNRKLIPVYTDKIENKFNQLLRLPHYQAKGFTIHPDTFRSLVESIWTKVKPGEVVFKYES